MADDPFTTQSKALQTRETRNEIAELQRIMGQNSFLSGVIERAKIKSLAKTVNAGEQVIRGLADVQHALADLDSAKLERARARGFLNNLDQILALDADRGTKDRLEAQEARLNAEHQAKLSAMRRAKELAEAQRGFEAWQAGQNKSLFAPTSAPQPPPQLSTAHSAANAASYTPPEPEPQPAQMSKAQREAEADLNFAMGAAEMRMEAEAKIAEYIRHCGGAENLTDEQKATIQMARDAVEQAVKDSGFV